MRKTKIICTLGPSTKDDEVLETLMLEGMNVARLNFSHGDYEQHKESIDRIKRMRAKLGFPIAILLDTKGPEIRTGIFENNRVILEKGDKFILTTREIVGTKEIASITYKDLPKDILSSFPDWGKECNNNPKILIDDGLIELNVVNITDEEIECIVENGGSVSNRKGVNVPNCNLSMPFIGSKDKADLIFGIEQGVDFVAASFTRCKEDVLQIREILDQNGGKDIDIIAKIENAQGVENVDEICELADGIMVARGDMGVEIPFEQIPGIQKKIIKKVAGAGKIVITATQMLDSMMKNPRPTRAETTDVANAIYDGTSAIMLSGETAAGAYPVEALKTMVRIAKKAEEDINYDGRFSYYKNNEGEDITSAISRATCSTAIDLNAKAIITITATGRTARMISRYRPNCPILCCTLEERVRRKMSMVWGVRPLHVPNKISGKTTESLFELAVDTALKEGYAEKGDLVVLTAGLPLGGPGKTNILKAHTAGE